MLRILRTLLLLWVGLSAAARPFDCGPMLLEPAPDGMTVVVHDGAAPAPTLVFYPQDHPDRRGSVRHGEPSKHHFFVLTGLSPDTHYVYRVQAGDVDSGTRSFRTLPQDPERFRFLAFGDLRSQPQQFHMLSEAIVGHETDALFCVTTGDYPADGRKYQLWMDQFFTPGRDMLAFLPHWPCIGNHERTRLDNGKRDPASLYFSMFRFAGDRRTDWYRWDYGAVTLLVLDSVSPMQKGSEQYAWLLGQLESPRRTFTVAAFHHPVFNSGWHGRIDKQGRPLEKPIRVAREEWRPLFEKYGVDLVLNGHDHCYERSACNGVQYVVTGGAGAPLYDSGLVPNPYQVKVLKTHHYCRITATPTRLTLEAVQPDGTVFDSFFIRKAGK